MRLSVVNITVLTPFRYRVIARSQRRQPIPHLRNALPADSLPKGIVESAAAVAPLKTALAFFVSGLLHTIQPFEIVDCGSHTLRELPHQLKR